MSEANNQRIPCTKCGAMILPLTAKTYGGLCPTCRREVDRSAEPPVAEAVTPPLQEAVTMQLKTDDARFDHCQTHLIRQIVRALKKDLEEAGIPKERLADVTGDVAFSVAAIMDGSHMIQADGKPVIPVVSFAEDAEGTRLIARHGGTFMHEYVYGVVDDPFDAEESE
jgi:hypothetical protein